MTLYPTVWAQGPHTSDLTLDHAREILSHGPSNEMLGTVSLKGLNYSREIDVGGGFRVLALSKNLGGGLILFSARGVAQASVATDEITMLQVFDLNDDGISELVTEEIEGRGTGILLKNFKLYMFDASGIKKVWQRKSYSLEAPWSPDHRKHGIHVVQCFLRFDGAGGGSPSRMTYLEPMSRSGEFRKTEYAMIGGAIRQLPLS